MAPASIPQFTPVSETVLLHLTRALAQQWHGARFDELHIEDRYSIIDAAVVAWHTVLDTLSGQTTDIPEWEVRCLTFSGEYDPALLGLRPDVM